MFYLPSTFIHLIAHDSCLFLKRYKTHKYPTIEVKKKKIKKKLFITLIIRQLIVNDNKKKTMSGRVVRTSRTENPLKKRTGRGFR